MKDEGDKERPHAAAIKYDPEKDRAPKLTAKGFGLVAERILEVARKYDIPIRRDADLSMLLSKLKLESEIPSDLYRAVAEILAVIYRVEQRSRSR
jgi:flagellar biosynthesis protein